MLMNVNKILAMVCASISLDRISASVILVMNYVMAAVKVCLRKHSLLESCLHIKFYVFLN